MTAIDEMLTLLKEQGFEHYKHEVPAEEDCVAFYDGNRWHDCWESVDGEVNVTFSMTPQEAIAATIGDTDATPTRQGDVDLAAENAKLRELLAKAGELIVIAEWPNVERDEMASAVMHDIRELGVDA